MQNVAEKAQDDGRQLFSKHVNGGISDIRLGLRFITTPGRKEKPEQSAEEDVDMKEGESTECSVEISEYSSKDSPDDDEEERAYECSSDEDGEVVGGLNELALKGR